MTTKQIEEREAMAEQRKATIFVDNLPNGIRKGVVYNLFSRFGRIWDCYIPNKRSRSTGKSFGFVRFESSRDARQAVQSTNGSCFWGQELLVNLAKFLRKQDNRPNQIYNQFNKENLEDRGLYRNQGRFYNQRQSQINNRYNQVTLEDGASRNQGRYNNQRLNVRPFTNNNSPGIGNQSVIYQKKSQTQMNNPTLKKVEERGKEVWRRKGVPESSKQRGNTRLAIKENESKNEGNTISVQAVGNGWLNRSAVGKIRRLISPQELEILFKKNLARNVQIKPMGGRFMIITFLNEEQRNDTLKEKWLELWFEEVKPWNGESAKKERFVWIACYGMPLNAWNVPSFKAIGSHWGSFIEVDSDTLREVSYAKARILIATENPNKIGGEVQLMVDKRKYKVTMEEEESFRTMISTNWVPVHAINSEPEEEDGEVDKVDGNKGASKEKRDNLVDDMEKQKGKNSDDRAKNNKEAAERVKRNGFIVSHQSGLEKESALKEQGGQGAMPIGIPNAGESSNEESSNSAFDLDSIVQDSQSPINKECLDSANFRSQDRSTEVGIDDKQEQRKDCDFEANIPVLCNSNSSLRASQVQGINLHVDLNPSATRRIVRSQQLEASLSSEGDEIEEFIIASQEREQNEIDKEVQNTIIAGKTLGIKFGDAGIKRMTKMIEDEAKILKAALKNNSFGPLMRDT